jgi:hypothetical protein
MRGNIKLYLIQQAVDGAVSEQSRAFRGPSRGKCTLSLDQILATSGIDRSAALYQMNHDKATTMYYLLEAQVLAECPKMTGRYCVPYASVLCLSLAPPLR